MKIGSVDLSSDILVVAEIGNNHEGDFDRARAMVREAAAAGVDAVKFQTFRTEHYIAPDQTARFAQIKSYELSYEQFAELAELARSSRVMFISTPLDLETADFLEGIVDAFKIASGDLDFHPLVRRVAATGKPMIISSGLSDLERVRRAVSTVEEVRGRPADPGLAVLHCVSSYPASPDDLNLNAIPFLHEQLGYPVGYSDHALGIDAAVVAVALGARVIEKHFTLEGIESDFRDHALSAKPAEMRALVERVRMAARMLGVRAKEVAAAEEVNVDALRRSLAAARDLDVGHVLEQGDFVWVRPGGGVPPGEEAALVGRRLTRAVATGERLLAADVE